jgi:hypothetical protein
MLSRRQMNETRITGSRRRLILGGVTILWVADAVVVALVGIAKGPVAALPAIFSGICFTVIGLLYFLRD